MTENWIKSRPLALSFVALSVLLGGWLRLAGLDARSVTHPEMYVPGIPLPAGISEPAERLTLTQIVTGTFSSDTHPPGYYILMLPWSRVFGTSLYSMRLPSALLGIACIPLLYCLGLLAGRPLAGAVAAALLALSGYHIFWSQVARMFALGCFLGLAASVVLLWIARGARHRRILTGMYVALILAGVATHVYFWSLFGAHLIWALGNAWGRRELPTICRAQLLALVLGSPLIAFAGYQSANTVADLSNNVPRYLAEFGAFAFALPTDASGFFPSAVPFTGAGVWWLFRGAILVTAIILLVAGLRSLWQSAPETGVLFGGNRFDGKRFDGNPGDGNSGWRSAWRFAWIAAGGLGALEIGGFVYASSRLPADFIHSTIRITEVLSILPVILGIGAVLLDRYWGNLPAPGKWKRWVEGEQAFLALLTIVPFGLLAGLAWLRPILNQRGMMFAAPYLFLTLAAGLVALPRKAWIVFPVVAIAFGAGLSSYRQMTVDPADYARFATSIQSEIRPDDLVFIRKAWYTTPILYYLHKDQYQLVGREYAMASAKNPDARVWVVLLYDSDPPTEILAALSDYKAVRAITVARGRAILYQRAEDSRRVARR